MKEYNITDHDIEKCKCQFYKALVDNEDGITTDNVEQFINNLKKEEQEDKNDQEQKPKGQ